MIAFEQLASLGIRNKAVRCCAWIVSCLAAAGLTVVSAGLVVLPYLILLGYAIWRLWK